ncbi:Putative Chalcone-flavanone isomerase [Rhizopus microsporus]|nr:Putative Chalcone-flavanone isomerase [Rhizopus microsporus]
MFRFSRPLLNAAKGTTFKTFRRQYVTTFPKKFQASNSKLLLGATVGIGFAGACLALQQPVSAEAPGYAGTVEDPASKLSFPIFLNTGNSEWKKLVGLGVRTVTFLQMHVYVLGLYMKTDDIESLKNLDGFKEFDRQKFLENEKMANNLVDQPYDISIRLVPVRATNTQHLRDGFVRLFMQRLKAQSLTEDEEREVLKAIQDFKSKFVNMNVKKQTEFIFTKTKEGGLKIVYEGKEWGTVNNKWVAKNFIMGYLSPISPSSEAALKDIADGFERLIK